MRKRIVGPHHAQQGGQSDRGWLDLEQIATVEPLGAGREPNLHRAHYDLGLILDQKGDHEAAFREYGKAVAVNPKLVEAHYNLDIHFENTGDHEAAVAVSMSMISEP